MAAVGTVGGNATKRSIVMMSAATGNVAKPATSTAGVACYRTPQQAMDDQTDQGFCFMGRDSGQATLMIKGRVTAGQTLVGTFTLWGYLAEADNWFEIPVNGGTAVTPVALAETDTDAINYQQRFENLGHYDRLALELAAIGGTGATFDAWLVTGRYGE